MKDKVLKVINVILEVILIISTLPFIGILLWAIYSSIFGSGFMGTEIYGWKAFALAIIAAFSSLSSILIVCLAYLIFYFGIVKKNKNNVVKHKLINEVMNMKIKVFPKILDIITKVIFFIALLSLTGLLGYGLCGAHFGYTLGITAVGFSGFKIYIENALESDVIYLCLALCCIYCMFYIIGYTLFKTIKCRNINKKNILNKIFLISFIPYFMILGAGLYSSKFRSRII